MAHKLRYSFIAVQDSVTKNWQQDTLPLFEPF